MDLKFFSWPLIAAFAVATAWGQGFALSRRDYLVPGYLLASADVDGDGNPDLFVGDTSGLAVRRGQSDGTFGESVPFPLEISSPWGPSWPTLTGMGRRM
jgi:FG-GAP-like repeat